jgi:predicted ATP-binding protein involved in virulence
MNTYWISRIDIAALWGHQDYKLHLHDDVNIIIGPNASGKTTIINLLHHALTGNLLSLSEIEFKEINISLRSFDGDAKATLRARQTEEALELTYGDQTASLPFGAWRAAREYPERYLNPAMRRRVQIELFDVKRQLLTECLQCGCR